MKECLIKIEHLRKEFQNSIPIKDVSTTINRGDIIAVIGPSGTGKSTFLRCLNRLIEPTSGKILVDGMDITSSKCNLIELRKKVGMVFQAFNLFENLTVLENLCVAQVQILGRSRDEAEERALKLLEQFGLADRADRYPDQLSGGQKQRVAIARTVAMEPEIILFDEPTSALDPTQIGNVFSVIQELEEQKMTMIIVTHEMQFARAISNRVFYMDEGTIYEEGTPEEIFENPQKEKTQEFIRKLRKIELKIGSTEIQFDQIMRQIIKFTQTSKLDRKHIFGLQLLFEELVMVQLVYRDVSVLPVDVEVRYSENENWIEVEVTYSGEEYNPMKSGDMISDSILSKLVKKCDYSYEAGTNRLIVRM